MKTAADVIVVGAGISGNATAYYLAKKGLSVIVLEASQNIGNGGSSRNGGGVRQSGRDPRELPLMIYGVKNIWPNLSEELGVDTEYVQGGNLRLGKTEEHLKILRRLADGAVNCGVDVRMIDAGEVRQINPYLSEAVIGASWCPSDGHANPLVTTLGFYKSALALGVEFITGCPVSEIILSAGKTAGVKTPENIFYSKAVIVCAGFESNAVLGTAGISIPMRKKLLQCLVTEAEPEMFRQMLGTAKADFYGHQTKHGSFVFGGHDGYEDFANPLNENNSYPPSTSDFVSACSRGITGYFPLLANARIVRSWGGYEDLASDGICTVSKVDEIPGLYVECGFSGHGFGIGPSAAFNIAELIAEGKSPVPLDNYRYNRFKPAL
ncbi:NAD(P)/FAD-dependent oxidoreductase [Treponema sp.]|uniref:NAD(P)/FAD-dependent oxidoreductase n=1 Tax=Treponema sp. TaxID=166 RepID=UPI003F1179EA